MIKAFAHKGLEQFFYEGKLKGIQFSHRNRFQDILDRLQLARSVYDMNFKGSGFHRLKGRLNDHYSVRVSGNWRIIFRFVDGDAYVVDYTDYH